MVWDWDYNPNQGARNESTEIELHDPGVGKCYPQWMGDVQLGHLPTPVILASVLLIPQVYLLTLEASNYCLGFKQQICSGTGSYASCVSFGEGTVAKVRLLTSTSRCWGT